MEEYRRHQIIWRMLYAIANRWICRKFRLTHEDLHVEGPVLLIPNHVTSWDPLLVAMSLRDKQVYYVASEHIFRFGLVSKLINWLVAPIPRRKAASGADTVKACLRHLRAGHSVCLFAEGEQSWDGTNHPIFPATGKLAKSAGATLVTYRLEGGYLSLPRWGKGVRRGKMHGHPVGIYPPEQLKAMQPEEINALIEQDIAENAWDRQREDPVAYRGKNRAEGLETALYYCPACRRIGTLHTRGDRIFCGCGLDLLYEETGFFAPDSPCATIHEWDLLQREAIKKLPVGTDKPIFSDGEMQLSRIDAGHRETVLGRGELQQFSDRLSCAGTDFPLSDIDSMAMVQANLLLLSTCGNYYQIRATKPANLRKYLHYRKEN